MCLCVKFNIALLLYAMLSISWDIILLNVSNSTAYSLHGAMLSICICSIQLINVFMCQIQHSLVHSSVLSICMYMFNTTHVFMCQIQHSLVHGSVLSICICSVQIINVFMCQIQHIAYCLVQCCRYVYVQYNSYFIMCLCVKFNI